MLALSDLICCTTASEAVAAVLHLAGRWTGHVQLGRNTSGIGIQHTAEMADSVQASTSLVLDTAVSLAILPVLLVCVVDALHGQGLLQVCPPLLLGLLLSLLLGLLRIFLLLTSLLLGLLAAFLLLSSE